MHDYLDLHPKAPQAANVRSGIQTFTGYNILIVI